MVEWATLQKQLPPQLKVSPLAVVPQLNRWGWMILDLSFPVLRQSKGKGSKQKKREDRKILKESVNDSTARLPAGAPVRKELGNVLSRLLRFMYEVPPEEEIHFAKIDLADGYWHMIVEEESRWSFAYVLPGPVDAPIRLVIPSALQMGWNKSPAYFRKRGLTDISSSMSMLVWRPPRTPPPGQGYKQARAKNFKCRWCT